MYILDSISLVKNSPFSLKSLKSLHTEDGVAWTATLYEGTKKVGTVEDKGDGGPMRIYADNGVKKRLKALSSDPSYVEAEATYLANLADATEVYKKMKRLCARSTLFVTRQYKQGAYSELKRAFDQSVKTAILDKYPPEHCVIFINEIL